jgi:hypothetical protein
MGTWAEDSFGNDTACDWAFSLEKQTDLSFIEKTIEKVLNAEFDNCDAEEAIAAAEVVARLQGHWGERNAYTEPADKWVEKSGLKPDKTLVQKVHQAIDRILSEPSELLELWQEDDEFEKWKISVMDLKSRVCV